MGVNHSKTINDFPVDIVYLWCDSSDKIWREKKNNELKKYGKSLDKDAISECRFINNNELKYSLRSVEKFAPWIRNIYIVSDSQVPDWLDVTNPKIHMVNHSEILPEYVLPTFNSCAIETAIHKIEGLSEHFLFANDDMFIAKPVEKSFFFDSKTGNPIFRFSKRKIINKVYKHVYGYTISKAYSLVEQTFGKSCAHFPHHNIDAYKKSDMEKCCQDFEDGFKNTAAQKFREKDCIQRSIYGYYAITNNTGTFKIVDTFFERLKSILTQSSLDSILIELQGSKLNLIKKYKPVLFCINDSLKTTDNDRLRMKNLLDKLLPNPSSFEKI